MKTKTIISAALAALVSSCASAPAPDYSKTPPAPGADIYRCTNAEGQARFVLVKPGTHQNWQGDHWGVNQCDLPDNTCKVDDEGFIVVETTVFLPSSKSRVDTIDIYNMKAGTVMSSMALNGMVGPVDRDTCTPHA